MSLHRVDVVSVQLHPHGNADALSIVKAGGFSVVVRTADWQNGQLGAYIEPDMVCPADRPEFAFLSANHKIIDNNGVKGFRIKVKRLRGVMSMGLLIPAPPGSQPGDNLIEHFGVVRYDPPTPMTTGGESCKAPPGIRYCYDVESAYRYQHLLTAGEEIVVTEKIHGANARYCFIPDQGMFAGSRTEWKKQHDENLWWKALKAHPEIAAFCEAHPEMTVYGEVYGQVQDLKYGASKNQTFIAVFDLLRNGEWVDHDEARSIGAALPWVPILHRGAWDAATVFAMADGKSEIAKTKGVDQIREGIVVKPIKERTNLEIGRTQLKIVSNAYLERT